MPEGLVRVTDGLRAWYVPAGEVEYDIVARCYRFSPAPAAHYLAVPATEAATPAAPAPQPEHAAQTARVPDPAIGARLVQPGMIRDATIQQEALPPAPAKEARAPAPRKAQGRKGKKARRRLAAMVKAATPGIAREPIEADAPAPSTPPAIWKGSTKSLQGKLALVMRMAMDGGLSGNARRVGTWLLAYINGRSGTAWPSVERGARELGLHADTVTRAFQRLVGRGYFELVKQGRGRGVANEYRAKFPAVEVDEKTPHGCGVIEDEKTPQRCGKNPANGSEKPRTAAPPLLRITSIETSGRGAARPAEPASIPPEQRLTPEDWRMLREAVASGTKRGKQDN